MKYKEEEEEEVFHGYTLRILRINLPIVQSYTKTNFKCNNTNCDYIATYRHKACHH